MTRETFNSSWRFRTKVTAFAELGGTAASSWTDVTLPHDALLTTARDASAPRGETNGYFNGGAFEYTKTFDAPVELRGKHVLLEFDGVYRDAAVFVNGNLAGQRAFGYSRFHVRIDPYLEFGGKNEIRVECRTHLDSRWYAGAGIYRDVHLIVQEPVHFVPDEVRIRTLDVETGTAVIEIEAEISNASSLTTHLRSTADITGPDDTSVASGTSPVTLLPGTTASVRHRLYVADPHLWSVDAPNLHTVRLTLSDGETVVDAQTTTFGIRTLQLDPRNGLRINGESIKLRGACIHSDNGPLGAISMLPAELRRVRILKEAGFNAIRSAHNPMSAALLEACDQLGMLVMDETFDVWTSGKSDFDYAFDFPEWWERDVEAMVARDFNHPSVIFYSIGNEIPETGTRIGSTWGRRLAEKVRSLDNTRYVTNGINGFVSMIDTIVPQMQARRDATAAQPTGGVNTMMAGFGSMMSAIQTSEPATLRTEESYAVLDVAGMNYSDARYELDRDLFPDRIIVGTETWPSSIAGNWQLVEANTHVLGDFTWTGWDYLGETGIGTVRYAKSENKNEHDDSEPESKSFSGGFPELTAWCGDIDIAGTRRPISFYRETVFGLRSAPYIAVDRPEFHDRTIAVATPWSWTNSLGSWSWPESVGAPIRVEVYSDAEEIELLLDGAPIDRSPVGEEHAFRVSFETVYQPGELTAVAYTDGSETGRSTLRSASSALQITALAERTELRADGTDLGYIDLALTDSDGTLHVTLDRQVSVVIEGPAVLQGFGSGAPTTTETFLSDRHSTFDGRAVAIIRPTGAGTITVTATADGCPAASVTFTAA
ncbi:glycoside hydrolase family 2 [Pseudoclavibacter sp. RFBJ3]|uniref:glycoside hydrolase family 2 TIM barrel-domain containing protein n=1 Tax=unclassified Pseudoclavibacter TaxID=2615177 RepID=UPI000CE86B9B|nr:MULTISPECIES: glycoside hydrolase family 2 TIM barrel-domain containing protein [unclassified Pseudoclavibacter]PPF87299.1 glycoside hydrolase family 2 [Pseudoclavibacter sp. RFBJ5]PPF90303.1 glycoside hydrolase family 2 [Pseudoclavibacter sp. RFBJ3]PPG00821.1 glycoside hydrolase family 2 [Pseudoclavibacter sp. RFBH5]PPG26067.1 glycoside hydrolase family 2 [Pseudoclavibacter sp. RFBI4]